MHCGIRGCSDIMSCREWVRVGGSGGGRDGEGGDETRPQAEERSEITTRLFPLPLILAAALLRKSCIRRKEKKNDILGFMEGKRKSFFFFALLAIRRHENSSRGRSVVGKKSAVMFRFKSSGVHVKRMAAYRGSPARRRPLPHWCSGRH